MIRLFPRTLFGRNFLLLVVIISVTQIAAFLFFVYFVTLVRLERVADLTALQINLTQNTIADFSPSQRDVYLKKLGSLDGVRIVNVAEVPPGGQPGSAVVRLFADRVKARLINPDSLVWQDEKRALFIRIFTETNSPYVVIGLEQIYAGPSGALIAAVLIASLAAFIGAYLFQRRLNRPLDQLAASARALGRGYTPAPLDANAPGEISVVSAEINNMAANLAKLNEEKTLMLAGVSHDLRTPLAKMRLSIEMLSASADQSLVSSLEKSAMQMEAIVNQFIDYARTGQDEESELCGVNMLLRDVLSLYTDKDTAHDGMQLELELSDSVPPLCRIRPLAITRALVNLINNARHYARPVDGSTNVISVVVLATDKALKISVLDRGVGISDADAARLIQPFTRHDAARSNSTRSGLGLAIVDRVVRLHGGELLLRPREGGGLAATLVIPLNTS